MRSACSASPRAPQKRQATAMQGQLLSVGQAFQPADPKHYSAPLGLGFHTTLPTAFPP